MAAKAVEKDQVPEDKVQDIVVHPEGGDAKQGVATFRLLDNGNLLARGEGRFLNVVLANDWQLIGTGVTELKEVDGGVSGRLADGNRFVLSLKGGPSGMMGACSGNRQQTLAVESGL